MGSGLNRRAVLAGAATLPFGLAGARRAFAQGEPPKPKQIVINCSGGQQAASLRKTYWTTFENETGIKIVDTSPVDFGKLRAMVESGNVGWNITEIGGQDGIRAADMKLAEPIDPRIVDRSNFYEQARDPVVYSSNVYSTVIAFRKDAFPKGGPTNWAEFWDVKRFPGPRSLRNHPTDNIEAALLADGVPLDKLYPLDLDRAFNKLNEIHPAISVWWMSGAQPAQLLIDNEVVLASGWNGRFHDILLQNGPLGVEWGGGVIKQSSWIIPRGAKDGYWGQKLLAYSTDPKRQATYSALLGYSGMNKASNDFVPDAIKPMLPLYPANAAKQVWLDQRWWNDNGAAVQERWSKWMLSKA